MTHLLDEPVNLVFHIQYTITRVSNHLLTYMGSILVGFVLLTAPNAVADSAAPFLEDHVAPADGLNTVHDKSMDDSKLTFALLLERRS